MKRLLVGIAIFGGIGLLGGCPIYSSQGSEYRVCQDDGCYSCPEPSYSGACINWQCSQNSDCDDGYVCNDQAQCVTAPEGVDGGNCTVAGCPDGYVCKLSNGEAPQCVRLGGDAAIEGSSTVDGGSHPDSGSTGDSATPGLDSAVPVGDAAVPVTDSGALGLDSATPVGDAAVPVGDAAVPVADSGALGLDSATPVGDAEIPVSDGATGIDASDAASPTVPCNADVDCGGHGARCVDGACAAQVDLCSDGTQCVVAGSSCVDGLCEAACSATAPCPSGYGCDFTRGVCNLDPGACVGAGASTCQGGATCVESHCVPPCSTGGESGTACAAGQVCVNGGCLPDQAATFACRNDGDQGLLSNDCATGFTCLHHDCYAACDVDASAGVCGSASCKDVTIETGTYGVCAAPATLGSDCDPAQGKACASGVCVNGTCE
jgi:hypothetical protein